MKKIISVFIVCCIAYASQAQVLDPKAVAKDAATNKANNNIESGVNNAADKVEYGIKGLFKKKKKTADTIVAAKVIPAVVAAPLSDTIPKAVISPVLKTYSNYDFLPGNKIIFEDNFMDDQDGEFPAHWSLGAGQAILNMIGNEKALKLTDGNFAHVKPLMKSKTYLTDTFTIEYDLYPYADAYPPHIYFYSIDGSTSELGQVKFDNGFETVQFSSTAGVDLSGNLPADLRSTWRNTWHHVAIAYRNKQMKIYVDQYRILVIPNTGIVPRAFDIEGIGNADNPIAFKNVRVANGGGMNMLGKKFIDAKIVTHGINFDVDKASIKPESMGTLNMIVGILKDNPQIKFEIDGHTDATGAAPHNLTLSQQRADAVKLQLISMGIDALRLTSKGFGSSKPISDNNSLEGKANNRRVEFIKK
ncbi:MAG: OmpA family protein [Chitinophagaceae bacterium]|nr:OmpA family protein [Chitinophagaceae bacterium]